MTACACLGPQNGDPVCPCAMRSGNYHQPWVNFKNNDGPFKIVEQVLYRDKCLPGSDHLVYYINTGNKMTDTNNFPVAWMTHHDEPMLFLTQLEALEYCDDDELPVPLYSQHPVIQHECRMLTNDELSLCRYTNDGMRMHTDWKKFYSKFAEVNNIIMKVEP
jgi:hypothetical protein